MEHNIPELMRYSKSNSKREVYGNEKDQSSNKYIYMLSENIETHWYKQVESGCCILDIGARYELRPM